MPSLVGSEMCIRDSIVAVHADDGLVDVLHVFVQVPDDGCELRRERVAHRVRDVHRRGARFDHRRDHFRQEGQLGPAGVLRAEFDVLDEGAGHLHAIHAHLDDLFGGPLELVLAVDLAGSAEHMDPRFFRGLDRFARPLDVLLHAAGQARHAAAPHDAGDLADRLEVIGAGDGKAGFDDVHAEGLKRPRDLDLLLAVERCSGALLPVPQCRVEDPNGLDLLLSRAGTFPFHDPFLSLCQPPCLAGSLAGWRAGTRPKNRKTPRLFAQGCP
eukprot:TRINITY_DN13973_c0_g1_i2.p3 TRINITY_DN13973_c0_g1~~TRINITY_DN13973_c0_g1_i2.p3  ORF type:complete len:270 (+),score=12.59 TRINITY_DN13973_c0_g1_i2:122-931(+)